MGEEEQRLVEGLFQLLHFELALLGLSDGGLVGTQSVRHFLACGEQRVAEVEREAFLFNLCNLVLGAEFALRKEGLHEAAHGVGDELGGIEHHRPCAVGPARRAREGEGGIESGAGDVGVVES